MLKKIIILFVLLLSSWGFVSQSKYIKQNDITIAKINIDTIIPKVELMNIQDTTNKENENIFYDVIISLKVIESNIKENNINKMKIIIDEISVEDFEIINNKNEYKEKYYNIKIKKINKNQKIKIIIPKGIIIDNANNENEEKTIEHKID